MNVLSGVERTILIGEVSTIVPLSQILGKHHADVAALIKDALLWHCCGTAMVKET